MYLSDLLALALTAATAPAAAYLPRLIVPAPVRRARPRHKR